MHLNFEIRCGSLDSFIAHWSSRYSYAHVHKYDSNIGQPLTEDSRQALFEWKNGRRIANPKLESIRANYPLQPPGDLEGRYLDPARPGGPIWNIFYLHCVNNAAWPIFDQHTYRAMRFISEGTYHEIGNRKKVIYRQYAEYRAFIGELGVADLRGFDKALFSFGRFLKVAKAYS